MRTLDVASFGTKRALRYFTFIYFYIQTHIILFSTAFDCPKWQLGGEHQQFECVREDEKDTVRCERFVLAD